jgi:hypothetical protein
VPAETISGGVRSATLKALNLRTSRPPTESFHRTTLHDALYCRNQAKA